MAKDSFRPPEAIARAATLHGQGDEITVIDVRMCAQEFCGEEPVVLKTSAG